MAEQEGNQKVADLYTQAGKAREAQAEALRDNDEATAALQEKMAQALGGEWNSAVRCYSNAAEAEKKGNQKEADLRRGEAQKKEAEVVKLREELVLLERSKP